MPDHPLDWRRQALGHLESLAAAGVAWLPNAAPLPPGSFPPVARTSTSVVQPGSAASAEPVVSPLEQRRHALQMLADEVKTCMKCSELCSTRTQTVFADGSLGAELCFIGEAPGADEDAQGLPFVGAAGQLLNKIIAACGLKREDVYICNILKCRPPNNRNPEPDEVFSCSPFLKRQIASIQPKVVCCLGKFAAQTMLRSGDSITRLRGQFHDIDGMRVIATFHPAYLLRSPEKKREVWEDMKQIRAELFRLRF
jgi:DNA polymerase